MKESTEQLSLAEQLMQTTHLLHRSHEARAVQPGEIDPRRGQGRILALLKRTGETSQRDLAYLLDIRQQSLAELLAKLEAAGYITREVSHADRRVQNIRLTEKGEQLELNTADPDDAFGCLTEEEQTQLGDYLTRVCDSLRKQLNELDESRPGPRRRGMMPPPHGPEGRPGMMPPHHGPEGRPGMMPPPHGFGPMPYGELHIAGEHGHHGPRDYGPQDRPEESELFPADESPEAPEKA